ncbi:MAG: hypothetical protein RIS35_2601 [Pseudomonadota bacterium]|jgi:membrane fusion protein (multidrug efflux system)
MTDPSLERQHDQSSRRKRGLLAVTAIVVLGAIGYGAWWFLVASRYVNTDNAYVQGNVVQVTPQVAGTVLAIHADDTDLVEAGQALVTLDPADANVALEQAEAQLGQAVREARALYANNAALASSVALREAEVARAKNELARVTGDLTRRSGLQASGAVGAEEVQHARDAVASARSALAAAEAAVVAAREQLTASTSLTVGTPVERHPNVLRAAGKVREAWLAVRRATLPAPLTGHVAKRSVQIGQRVQAGAPLMAVVPLDQVWVEANFKEAELRGMRIGQPAQLTADLYGKDIKYTGTVVGLGAGTGASFALLPAQNATGNWIKVVQRVPVRIALDPKQVREHPLRVGLSMHARVDIRNGDGEALAGAPRRAPVAATPVFDALDAGADARVAAIIAANLAGADRPVTGSSKRR